MDITPKIARKLVNQILEDSYIEEEDATYIYEDTEITDESEIESDSEDTTEVEDDQQDDKTSLKFDTLKPTGKIAKFIAKHEIVRKGLHSSIGFFSIWLYTLGVHQTQLIMPLSILFIVIITNDYVRFRNPEINKIIVKKFYYLIRESEINHYNGTLYYLVGLVIVFSCLPKDISLMSILLLSWADTAASTFGRAYGKYTFQIAPGKSFAGALASFITGVLSCYLLYGYLLPGFPVNEVKDIMWTSESSKLSFHQYSLVCGIIASVSECVSLFGLDDNFTIPVLGGFGLYGVVTAFKV